MQINVISSKHKYGPLVRISFNPPRSFPTERTIAVEQPPASSLQPFCLPQTLSGLRPSPNLRPIRDRIAGRQATPDSSRAVGNPLEGQIARLLLDIPGLPAFKITEPTVLVLDAYISPQAAQAAYTQRVDPVLSAHGLEPQPVQINRRGAPPRLIGCRTGTPSISPYEPYGVLLSFTLPAGDERDMAALYRAVYRQLNTATAGLANTGALVHLAFDCSNGGQRELVVAEAWNGVTSFHQFGVRLRAVLETHQIPPPIVQGGLLVIDYAIGLPHAVWPSPNAHS